MKIVGHTDWSSVDISSEDPVGDHITLPDGSKHHILMTIGEWYWLEFMIARGHTTEGIAQDVLDAISEHNENLSGFDYLFRTAIRSYGITRAELFEAKRRGDL